MHGGKRMYAYPELFFRQPNEPPDVGAALLLPLQIEDRVPGICRAIAEQCVILA